MGLRQWAISLLAPLQIPRFRYISQSVVLDLVQRPALQRPSLTRVQDTRYLTGRKPPTSLLSSYGLFCDIFYSLRSSCVPNPVSCTIPPTPQRLHHSIPPGFDTFCKRKPTPLYLNSLQSRRGKYFLLVSDATVFATQLIHDASRFFYDKFPFSVEVCFLDNILLVMLLSYNLGRSVPY